MNSVSVFNSTAQHENVLYGNSSLSICQFDPALWTDLKEEQRYWIFIKEIPDQNIEDKNLCFEKSKKLEDERRCWREVLRRVVECLKFLYSRGLALRGDSEEIGDFSNGKFLKALNNIASAKYFSLIVDSSTDTSHCNQLAIIIRYVSEEAVVEERFIGFESSCGHSGKAMADVVKKTLDKLGLNIKAARCQSYDNASNMSGKCKCLQALQKNENPNIELIPCAGHSLNLVGYDARIDATSMKLQDKAADLALGV
ncbi:uncharacterized protein LOC136095605 [Hydra vulgaris]|uniref:uncharacterized protein LOC136095605 n=1 Tax=Hydra vulgaris TaxID=6087 RepID=UPI0032E9DB54